MTSWAPMPTVLPQARRSSGATASPGPGSTSRQLNMVGMLFLLDAPGTEYPSGEPHHTPIGPEFRAGTPTHASASVGSVTPRSDSVPIPVAAPARVADRLAAAPDGPVAVLHACRDTLHLDVAGHAVGVLAAGATGLPHALRSRLPS